MRCGLLLLALVCLVCLIAAADGGRSWRRNGRCRRPKLENGVARMRSRGRVARYRCYRGFTLYPGRFNTCVRRKWLEPHSVCVKAGCEAPPEIPHGQQEELLNGGVITFTCSPGFELSGHASMYCNGLQWNGTVPTCEPESLANGVQTQVECDFEDDLCGWTHGEAAEFQWTRHSGRTPSTDMFTGPSYDHTLGEGQRGNYMYIEASDPRVENDTARLFSPVFAASQSLDACFSLWYHMWGSSLGAIRVYILPVDESFDQLDGPAWERTHSMGNRWINKIIPIPEQTAHFQVVVEGVRGENYMSDAAIDDVALRHGDACTPPARPPLLPSAPIDATDDEANSCEGRCGERRDPAVFCSCTDDCQLDGGCCNDYYRVCLEEDGVADGKQNTHGGRIRCPAHLYHNHNNHNNDHNNNHNRRPNNDHCGPDNHYNQHYNHDHGRNHTTNPNNHNHNNIQTNNNEDNYQSDNNAKDNHHYHNHNNDDSGTYETGNRGAYDHHNPYNNHESCAPSATPSASPPITSAAPPTSTETPNELPPPIPSGEGGNALPQLGGQPAAVSSRSSAGLPMYAIAAIACGVLLVAAVLSALAGRRYCRPRQASRLSDADELETLFTGLDADPTIDCRPQTREAPVPKRPAPSPPPAGRARADSADLGEFTVEDIGDDSETTRLTGN
ncbi:MAM and LDL-receptor class A domain-containing protein 2 [Amphibalanus amphitrite]|uniref:MAM and LDL-receptor class A domain-containing protein 2 n=1 Tax=Amphibalanus amphitrite TaxID=1232801 RepID=A0A6A4V689_AMPAM|nr:MAM and LDL-receptor class A domain-containing protein 2 [Amphibalanus amphitrite]